MIIPNKLIKLEYDPSKDILFVEWPDFEYYSLPELHNILDNIVTSIRHYDINYLLIDARTTVVSIKEDKYSQMAKKFAQDLMQTRLRKVVCLTTQNSGREKMVEDLKVKTQLSVAFGSFNTMDEALSWFQS